MNVDAFTLVAQLVNFLLLVALLERFLYRPVLEVLDAREAGYRERAEETEILRLAAQEEAEVLRGAREELEKARRGLLEEARREAERHRQELLDQARAEVQERQQRWLAALEEERETRREELSRRLAELVLAGVRRVLEDLAGAELERLTVEQFLQRAPESVEAEVVRTGFELPTDLRRRLRDRLGEVRFEQDPAVGFGVELVGGSHRVGFSLDSYLDELRREAVGWS